MFPRFNGWLIPAGISFVALLAACVQVAPVAFPRLSGQATIGQKAADSADAASASRAVVATPTAQTGTSLEVPATATARARAAATPTPNPLANRQTTTVHRGPLTETLELGGRVAPVQEAPLSFSMRGAVDTVPVKPGQTVHAGDVLATLSTGDAARDLANARAELEITRARQQALAAKQQDLAAKQAAQARARQDATVRNDQISQQRVAEATAKAEEQVRLAQANFEKVSAGASSAERLSADGALASARGTLAKAEADLARLRSGPTAAERRAAEQAVSTAQIALRKVQADLDNLIKPADPAIVANARAEVAAAQADLERASSDSQPKDGPKLSDAERQQRKQAATFALKAATERLDALLKGPDKASVDLANMAVESANAQLSSAQAHLQELTAPPTQEQLADATNAVDVAQIAVRGAEAHVTEVKSHPTEEELRVAQKQVDDAQAALDRAAIPPLDIASPGDSSAAGGDPNATSPVVEDLTLRLAAEQQQAQIQSLQQQLAASRIVAPFEGIIGTIQMKPGDTVEPYKTVLTLASPDAPIVMADVSDADASALDVGTPVLVQVEATKGQIKGSIVALADSPGGSGRVVKMQVDWPEERPALGIGAQVTAITQQKDDALIVAQRAVRSSGERRSVEVIEGGERKTVEVKVGIAAGDDVEILSGLREGQVVLLPN